MTGGRNKSELPGFVRIGAVVVVMCLGVWGCARNPGAAGGGAEAARELRRRAAALKHEVEIVQQAREKAKKELALLEEEVERLEREAGTRAGLIKERDQLRRQAKAAQDEGQQLRKALAERTGECDELRLQLSARLGERDVLQTRCERLRKGLQSVLVQDDTPLGAASSPVSTPAGAASSPVSTPAGQQ
jgi:Sec-independent protein translocase protein TatA